MHRIIKCMYIISLNILCLQFEKLLSLKTLHENVKVSYLFGDSESGSMRSTRSPSFLFLLSLRLKTILRWELKYRWTWNCDSFIISLYVQSILHTKRIFRVRTDSASFYQYSWRSIKIIAIALIITHIMKKIKQLQLS